MPHHTASNQGIIGGGKNLKPGEVFLAADLFVRSDVRDADARFVVVVAEVILVHGDHETVTGPWAVHVP